MTDCREYPIRYSNGYGRRYLRGSKPYRTVLMHRWVWEQVNGPIPAGLDVMHTCDNRACYRLDHLRLGTRAMNIRDMYDKGRGRPAESYKYAEACGRGHLYDEANTYVAPDGGRHCRACGAENARRRRREAHRA